MLLWIAMVFCCQSFAQASRPPEADILADCSCLGTRHYSACEIGWKPEVVAVFVGRVTARDHQPLGSVDAVTLNVEEVFRGSLGATVVVRVHTHLCSPWLIPDTFEEGKEYLVYATQSKDADLQLGSDAIVHDFSEPRSCSWKTVKLEDAPEELAYWRNISHAPDTGRVFGTAKKYIRELMFDDLNEDTAYQMELLADRTIVVEGLGHTYRTQTDANGKYEVDGLPPGSYQVFPADNPQQSLAPVKEQVDLQAKGCAQVDFRDYTSIQENDRKLEQAIRRKRGDMTNKPQQKPN
jgi:hypothetical protein